MPRTSRRLPPDITKNAVYRQLKGRLYYPYYLSAPKIESLFAQLWGDLKGFTQSRSAEISSEVGITAKTSALLQFIAELAATARIGGTRQWVFESDYDVPDLLKFILLRRFLTETSRVRSLIKLSEEERKTPHLFVEYYGTYFFAQDIKELHMPQEKKREIARRKRFEESAEEDPHYLLLLPSISTAIIARRFLSAFGHRFLPHHSEGHNVTFFGATIGESKGVLFLDPMAIGYHETASRELGSA